MKKALVVVVALILAGAGCKPASAPEAAGGSAGGGPAESSVMDAVTQKNKLEAGKKAAAQIRQISAEQQQNMEEALGE